MSVEMCDLDLDGTRVVMTEPPTRIDSATHTHTVTKTTHTHTAPACNSPECSHSVGRRRSAERRPWCGAERAIAACMRGT